jgi:hypothetical protein
MSRKANRVPNMQSGRDDADRDVYDASQRGRERSRIGLARRWRDQSARPYCLDACPSCGVRIRDLVIAQLGFCDRCDEFTGMCGAGRRIICPDVMTRTTWHTPCTELGTMAWDITQVQGRWRTVLCRVHDMQVRHGGTPWIEAAVPLDPGARRGWAGPLEQAADLRAYRARSLAINQ